MHEHSLVADLLARIEATARAHAASAVYRVTVKVGPLAGVDPGLLATAFRDRRAGTVCADAELVVVGDAIDWRCTACGAPIPPGSVLVCPSCAMPARLAGGDALVLERLELEVPDHV
jgi:hydrogenase nickel incorporation protein HypA/HybF